MPVRAGRAPRGRPQGIEPHRDSAGTKGPPKGESGNPQGRPKSALAERSRAARDAFDEKLVSAAEAIYGQVFTAAKAGDLTLLKELLVRLVPPRSGRPIRFPKLVVSTPADCGVAMEQVLDLVATAVMSPEEALKVVALIERRASLFSQIELSEEFRKLEARIDEIAKRRATIVPLHAVGA